MNTILSLSFWEILGIIIVLGLIVELIVWLWNPNDSDDSDRTDK